MLSPDQLTEFVKSEARRLDFTLVGVTTPEPPDHLGVYRDWIRAGRHGEMAYLETERAVERRADPRKVLPECQSILVLTANYQPKTRGHPGVARYALGEDYHEVLITRLRQLVGRLENLVEAPFPYRIYSDTGPLLERELAQRAGLGWIGKNTCLISPEHGSYMFLAEVLLGLELVPDPPVTTDHCGSCTLCIEACPTQCILPDRTLDSRRCISYLTIELRGPIPEELRTQLGGWTFGCDICQEVCPWNLRFAEPTDDAAFQPRRFLLDGATQSFLELSVKSYREQLRGSPLKRAKREGLLRNASINAALDKDSDAIGALERVLLEESHPLARAHAAWALGQLGSSEALLAAKQTERDPEVLEEIEAAIRQNERRRN